MSAERLGPHPTKLTLTFDEPVLPENTIETLFIIEAFNLLVDRTQDFVEHAYHSITARRPTYLRWVVDENGVLGLSGCSTPKAAPTKIALPPKP